MYIRQAAEKDVSRIAEILVFNNRVNHWPIFQDESYSFGEMQVLTVANGYLSGREEWKDIYVYDDGIVRGFTHTAEHEIKKLYVDTFFQGRGIGGLLAEYAIAEKQARALWVLEKNTRAIRFYERHGFFPTGVRTFEEGTTEYLIRMERPVTAQR